ncbi:hypothetical protein PF008_g10381 [Phytophthora fragariae]|uniref:Uncharacterized protein n=1 Tax=Phytophthora fragariae TaxID=53985 RepID=A0A6G0RVG4_9STRA|nr:hypothetical protein PF008_g10381 [Phytophthora fragariae]
MAMPSPGRDTPAVKTSPAEKEKTESVRITNTSTLPVTSRYAGSTMKDLQRFMSAYDTYYHSLTVADMHHILEEHTVEQVMLEREQKKILKYFVAAIEPAEFREAIEKRLQCAQHKDLKTDIVKGYAWVLERLKAYLVWQPAQVKPQARAQSKFGQQRRRPTTVAMEQNLYRHRETTAAVEQVRQRASNPPPKPPSGNPPRRIYLKCESQTHLVRQCPDGTPDEVDNILAA